MPGLSGLRGSNKTPIAEEQTVGYGQSTNFSTLRSMGIDPIRRNQYILPEIVADLPCGTHNKSKTLDANILKGYLVMLICLGKGSFTMIPPRSDISNFLIMGKI